MKLRNPLVIVFVLYAMEGQQEPATSSSLSGLPMEVNGSVTTVPLATQVSSSNLLAPHFQAHSPEEEFGVTHDVFYCPVSECTRAKGPGFLSQRKLQTVRISSFLGVLHANNHRYMWAF